jgi:magnesium chelatase family protein
LLGAAAELAMPSTVSGATLLGVDGVEVIVEVDLLRRLPCVVVVGLPSTSVRESAERVRSAILAAGFEFPRQRVVVSLGPADLKKEGTALDLAIAMAILVAAGVVPPEVAHQYLYVGELALSGGLRAVRGVLAYACLCKARGLRGIVVPAACVEEASLVEGIEVRGAQDLAGVVAGLAGGGWISPVAGAQGRSSSEIALDLRDVRGQPLARLALEVAAAGGHNLLMVGPPGCGKSMLAARLPSILPPMSAEDALECTRIHSAAGLRPPGAGIVTTRPFRAPHHSVSIAGLLGGASLRPGEASLAHHGVLFLDEFPEFMRSAREALRAPMEDRRVVIARAGGRVVFPARFMLVAAANPCPCGYLGNPTRPCACTMGARQQYQARLTGPLVDRVDLCIDLAALRAGELLEGACGEASAPVRERVGTARRLQAARNPLAVCNAELRGEQVTEGFLVTRGALAVLREEMERNGRSARVSRRLLGVARTLADLAGSEKLHDQHVRQAVLLRREPAEVAP